MAANQNNKEQQKIVNGFRGLREAQQELISELKAVEGELRELCGVINVMKTLDPKNASLIRYGDSLIKTTIGEDLVSKHLEFNRFSYAWKLLNQNLMEKTEELIRYQKEHNIRVLTEQELAELEKQQAQAQAVSASA